MNLTVLVQRLDLTKTEKSERWKLIEQTKTETEEINRLLDAFNSLGSHPTVKEHLLQPTLVTTCRFSTRTKSNGRQ